MITEAIIISIISSFFSLAIGLGVAFFVHYLQNRPSVIRRKTREEAIQKLKLDAVINIIEETNELQSAVGELNVLITNMTIDILPQLKNKNYLERGKIVWQWKNKFIEDSRMTKKKIDKFAFLVIRDIRINSENLKEQEAIKNELLKIQMMPKEIIETIEEIKDHEINDQNISDIAKKIKTDTDDRFKIITEFIDSILIMYAIRLN